MLFCSPLSPPIGQLTHIITAGLPMSSCIIICLLFFDPSYIIMPHHSTLLLFTLSSHSSTDLHYNISLWCRVIMPYCSLSFSSNLVIMIYVSQFRVSSRIQFLLINVFTVGLKTVAKQRFLSMRWMWRFRAWKWRLVLAGKGDVLLLGYQKVFWPCNLAQYWRRYAHFKLGLPL